MESLRLRLKTEWERSPRNVVVTTATTVATAVGVTVLVLIAGLAGRSADSAEQEDAATGTVSSFAVLAGTLVSNTGASVVSGDLGVSPGTSVTGFPPGKLIKGVEHAADAAAGQARAELASAYSEMGGRPSATPLPADLGGLTLQPGVYNRATAVGLTGTLTLDAGNDPSAVFIVQAGTTLATAAQSTVELVNGAQACRVYWQVAGAANLGAGSTMAGSILALASVSVQRGATVDGQLLARTGYVSLDTSTVTRPTCRSPRATTVPPPATSDAPDPAGPSAAPDAEEPTRTGSTTRRPTTAAPSTTDPATTDPTTTETTTTETTTTETTTTETTTTETTTTETETEPPPPDPPPPDPGPDPEPDPEPPGG